MITEEVLRRPLVRPLLVWIAGILLQSTTGCSRGALLLLLLSLLVIIFAFVFSMCRRREVFSYDMRWLWGAAFLPLLLSFAMQRTALRMTESEEPKASSLTRVAREKQMRLVKPFERLRLTEEEKSVLATITLGYRGDMSRDVRQQFSVTGVAHILSVSGFHVAVVCGFLTMVFSFLPGSTLFRWLRYLSTMALLWCFVAITGMAASAVRSGLMLSFYLSGRVLLRRTDGYNTLAAAAFCMLAYDPLYLFDIGFQLSYLAVLSILFLWPRIHSLIVVRNPLLEKPWSWVAVAMAAQAGTALLSLYYFRQFSLVFLFTNLPLSFLSTYLIPAGLLYVLLPPATPGYGLLELMVEKLTHAMFWIVEAFSRVTQAALWYRIDGGFTLLGYASIVFFLLYIKTRRPKMLLTGLLLLLLIIIKLIVEDCLLPS